MNKHQQQAILARDIIDMIQEYPDDANVLEYLEGFTFSLGRIFADDSWIDWSGIAGICDQRYYSLKQGAPLPLDVAMLTRIQHEVAAHLPAISALDQDV